MTWPRISERAEAASGGVSRPPPVMDRGSWPEGSAFGGVASGGFGGGSVAPSVLPRLTSRKMREPNPILIRSGSLTRQIAMTATAMSPANVTARQGAATASCRAGRQFWTDWGTWSIMRICRCRVRHVLERASAPVVVLKPGSARMQVKGRNRMLTATQRKRKMPA